VRLVAVKIPVRQYLVSSARVPQVGLHTRLTSKLTGTRPGNGCRRYEAPTTQNTLQMSVLASRLSAMLGLQLQVLNFNIAPLIPKILRD
jgi:hypothetical protein